MRRDDVRVAALRHVLRHQRGEGLGQAAVVGRVLDQAHVLEPIDLGRLLGGRPRLAAGDEGGDGPAQLEAGRDGAEGPLFELAVALLEESEGREEARDVRMGVREGRPPPQGAPARARSGGQEHLGAAKTWSPSLGSSYFSCFRSKFMAARNGSSIEKQMLFEAHLLGTAGYRRPMIHMHRSRSMLPRLGLGLEARAGLIRGYYVPFTMNHRVPWGLSL